jgi:hypothetical protein
MAKWPRGESLRGLFLLSALQHIGLQEHRIKTGTANRDPRPDFDCRALTSGGDASAGGASPSACGANPSDGHDRASAPVRA